MSVYQEYQSKLRTPEQAVQAVKSGDWVDYSCNVCFPTLLDAALAKRKDELWDVKLRGNLIFGPIRLKMQSFMTIWPICRSICWKKPA